MGGPSSPSFPSDANPVRVGGPAPAPPLDVTATVPQASYLPGEVVAFGIAVRNVSGTTLTVEPFMPEVDVVDALTEEAVRSFAAGSEKAVVAPA